MLKVGYHFSVAGGLYRAYDRAAALAATAMQIFISSPRSWNVKYPDNEELNLFIKKHDETGIYTVCHMPYLPNLSSSGEFYKKSIESFAKNIEVCSMLRIPYLITHIGSHMGKGKGYGLNNVINALESASDYINDLAILLENQAGHANSVGAELSDLLYIYDNCSLAKKKKLGFCLDTCHLFAAGYDVRDEEELDRIGAEFGYDKVYAYHMNDSKFPLGSKRDRHENIGLGHIGMDGFRVMLSNSSIRKSILILETPYNSELPDGRDLAALRKLAGEAL
ncbi:MAG: deoxyribonuclease IV [Candidatus Micrarchaeaceae archaeon]